MAEPRKYPNELRERSQRMVAEAMSEDPSLSLTAAVKRVGPRVGVNADTLRGWIRRSDIDAGRAPGVSTADAATVKALQAEVRELKRANEMALDDSALLEMIEMLRTADGGELMRRLLGGMLQAVVDAGPVATASHSTSPWPTGTACCVSTTGEN